VPPSRFSTIAQGIAGAVRIGGTIILRPLIPERYAQWGATEREVRQAMAGDEYVPEPRSAMTLAVTVNAPREVVWPWLAQLGCGRGGWYSYDLLDNGGRPSADRVVAEWQDIKVGDRIAAVPGGGMSFPVSLVHPPVTLVLGGTLDTETNRDVAPGQPLPARYFGGAQIYRLEDAGPGKTRLIFRNRMTWNPCRMLNLVYSGIVEPITFNMGRKMLLTIKRRVEAR
jgi:proline iminopeptidase